MSDSVTLWIIACQAPLSVGFSRQEYWSGLSCHPSGVYLLAYFWLCWVLVAAWGGFSLVAERGGYSSFDAELLLEGASRCGAWARGCSGFSSRGAWTQWLWPTGLVALQYVGSSRISDETYVSHIGRQILYH